MRILQCFLLVVSILFTGILAAQTQDAFTHRAKIIQDGSIPEMGSSFVVSVEIQGEAATDLWYSEQHDVVTDEEGWYSIKIGSGVTSSPVTLNDIDWTAGKLFLAIEVTDAFGNAVSESVNELLEIPAIAMTSSIESRSLITLACLEDLEELRAFQVPEHGDMICIKGHTSPRDGGEGFFYFLAEYTAADDDGIIIKPNELDSSQPGRWVRKLDGFININYYGLTAGRSTDGVDNYLKIQRAVDFAANNRRNDHRRAKGEIAKGNTVFFPNGEYIMDGSVKLYNGVALLGEENTMLTARRNASFDYFFTIGGGRVTISMKDMWLNGNKVGSIGGMFFKAQPGPDGTGGLWQSRFVNLNIINFMGHGIHLEGSDTMGLLGENNYKLPNQFNVFENVRITRVTDESNSLRMTMYQGQHTFINCLFMGKRDRTSLGTNVFISNSGGNVVTFLNCTVQESIHGIEMENSSSITIDNCWFENLYNAVDVTGGRSINILNSRFANSAGYGSERHTGPDVLPQGIGPATVVAAENSSVNVERSFVLVTNPNEPEVADSFFIVGRNNIGNGLNTNNITTRANNFADDRLSRTFGLVPGIDVSLRTIILNGRSNVMAVFDGTTVLRFIESTVSGGEQISLTIRKDEGRGIVKIKDWKENRRKGNISLDGRDQIELADGQTVTFMKVDPPVAENGDEPLYKLVSISN
ncbi:MAG: glycosyl hydrolase family 28-related protein [Bacteroidota bacterium]